MTEHTTEYQQIYYSLDFYCKFEKNIFSSKKLDLYRRNIEHLFLNFNLFTKYHANIMQIFI